MEKIGKDKFTAANWAALILIVALICLKLRQAKETGTGDKNSGSAPHGAVLNPQGHACRWNLCPYKGVRKPEWERAVTRYVGEDAAGTDAWCIDVLHLEYPKDEYDDLEARLFGGIN